MANWFVTAKKADFNRIAQEFGISPVLARLIRNRDVCGDEEIRKFLHGGIEDLYAPELLKGMDKAVAVIKKAIAEKKKIRVIGDYDIDGVCAACILVKSFRSLGADVDMAIPHRIKDGYGLNDHLIERAAAEGIKLIVTCDNGIAASEQIDLAHRFGMEVVVTDHHEVPFTENPVDGEREYHLPPAEAVVDPKQPGETYPFPGICGAAVAWKLVWALGIDRTLLDNLLEPAAFATIGDVMELRDENRILVKEGLKRMRRTSHPGLRALIEVNGLDQRKLEAYHIGFVLGPCINASGRLESAALSLKLWLEEDYRKAVPLAADLKNLNDSRKAMTEMGLEQAVKLVKRDDKVLVLYLPACHESLAGIIAGRIRERYHRPTIILTDGEGSVKGSGRSIEGYDMFAELSACRDLFDKFGGHKMAAGLSLAKEHIGELKKRLNDDCRLTEEDFTPKVHIDVALPLSYVSEGFIEELGLLEPFGTGNPKPVFAQKNVLLRSGRIFGKNRNVAKFHALDPENIPHTLVYFGDVEELKNFISEEYGAEAEKLFSGGAVSLPLTITYYPRLNEFGGRREIEFVVTNYC